MDEANRYFSDRGRRNRCVVGLAWLTATYGGLDYKCVVEGPRRESAPFAVASEAVRVHGSFSSWPLGRACEWEWADGQGFVTAGPGWTTIASVGAVVLATGGARIRSDNVEDADSVIVLVIDSDHRSSSTSD